MTNIQHRTRARSGLYSLLVFFLASVCWFTAAQAADEAGKIVLSVGETRMSGKTVRVDDIVPVGAELSTGPDGYLYLKTIDNGFLILRPGSVATVEAYEVNHENPEQSRFKFFLRQGIARSISGEAVGKARKNFRFNTPVAAIGVRGTDFSVYTDPQETRVIVSSGGVIVAGFGALCSPQGIGPCEGANSAELMAGTAYVLLVRKGQSEPQISQNKDLSPDLIIPPRLDEPEGKATSRSQGRTRNETRNESKVAHQDATSLEPIKKPVIWGRWQSISEDLPATMDSSSVNNKEYSQITLGNYILFREQSSAFPAPSNGILGFTLQGSNLAHVSDPASGASAEATLSNGTLNFNFSNASFTTKVDLSAMGETHVLHAKGKVTQDGFFSNTPAAADGNMLVRGFMFKDTQQADSPGSASYLFRSTLSNGWEANGVANWGKR